MNTKTLTMNLTVAALLLGATAAHAARPMPLADAVRHQMENASAQIQADIGATVKEQPLVLDVPGVEVGTIELVKADRLPENVRPKALLESADAGISAAIRLDLINKAREVPGMFGVYRYMAVTAQTVAIVTANYGIRGE